MMGTIVDGDGTHFAVWSQHALSVDICLFDRQGLREERRVRLTRDALGVHRGFIKGVREGARYGVRADGRYDPDRGDYFDPDKLLTDPYATRLDRAYRYDPRLAAPRGGSDTADLMPKCIVTRLPEQLPHRAALFQPGGLIYELPVRAFSRLHPALPDALRGRLGALAHPVLIDHFVKLGVTAVELMPITACIDERHLPPLGLGNGWGYNPVGFMALDPRLAPGGLADLRHCVAALQDAGIAVILDLVFNHSGESDALGPTLSLRGLDNRSYYRHSGDGRLIDDTGCGNSLDCTHPAVLRLILDSMRYFVAYAGIDGFRFDLATSLGRTPTGFDRDAPLWREIGSDPLLADRLLIAEPWDVGPGGYRLGQFPARFLEWNDRYRDDVRRFWRRDAGMVGSLATRLAGSSDIFAGNGGAVSRSVNFIAAHDGLTLADLTAYAVKHNEANGEQNRDGSDNNLSWNHGVEGDSSDAAVLAARRQDVRALLATLFASKGTIMLTAGDEFGRSQGGNNNAYCQDNDLVWLDWQHRDHALEDFVAELGRLRRDMPCLRDPAFLDASEVDWLTASGRPCDAQDWQNPHADCLTMLLRPSGVARLAVVFNRGSGPISFVLPSGRWRRLAVAAPPDDRLCLAPRSVAFLVNDDYADQALGRLADLAGIEAGWWDYFGRYQSVSAATKRAFLTAMGCPNDSDASLAASLALLLERPWQRWLAPVQVILEGEAEPTVLVTISEQQAGETLHWTTLSEDGVRHAGLWRPGDGMLHAERRVTGTLRRRTAFRLPYPLGLGLHRLTLEGVPAGESSLLIVAPTRAFQPEALSGGRRLWGIATQLYALSSDRNWGIGDFSDLAELARRAGRLGAALLGINPLHALFAGRPERVSPYFPSSRTALNTLPIDVTMVPDYIDSQAAQELVRQGPWHTMLASAQGAALVDYAGVTAVKQAVLETCWDWFQRHHLTAAGTDRGQDFALFRRQGGAVAEYALFEALQESMLCQGFAADWRSWPADYRDPGSRRVKEFAVAAAERVGFFHYLQWLADSQLAAVQRSCRAAGMSIGLYRDLGVGIAPDGAEAWANQDLLCLGVSVGAPPDPLNLAGQDWGLPPFNPLALQRTGYPAWLQMIEANMAHAGALRLDHAMGLQRLYWVPAGARADQGAYVRYPADDMFALLRLASVRRHCLVIGEDLGNVPEDFRARLTGSGIFGTRLLAFEKTGDGFKAPGQIDESVLAGFGSHDLPSLSGWWRGIDIDARRRLALYTDPALAEGEAVERAQDRRRLVAALAGEGLLPPDFPDDAALVTASRTRLALAVHHYLGRTPAKLIVMQIEDALDFAMQMNLPGTVDQFPNWRQRYALPIAALMDDPVLRAIAESWRRQPE